MVSGVILLVVGLGLLVLSYKMINPRGSKKEISEMKLAKYDFNELKKRGGRVGKIEILGKIKEVEDRRKYKTDFETRQISFESEGKKVTGMINYWNEDSGQARMTKRPVIIMIRGYAEKTGYYSGSGSWRMADQLAKAGFATISLDFLGYGESDGESTDMLEARFEKVASTLDLIESVKALPWVDKEKIGMWAHSNGGQIALSVLEVTGENYPTVLWAPMTDPFPQSVLDTASELDDEGKAVREAIANFEKKYDARRYAFENYYAWIKAPIVIHQGTGDEWCKAEWQEAVVNNLVSLGKEAMLYVYENDDHNLSRNWNEVVETDVEWFKERI